MTDFDFKRRFVLKGIGAFGVGSVIVACGGGGNSGSSAAADPDNPSGGRGVTPNGPAPAPAIAQSCNNPGYQYPLYIDAASVSTGIPANIPVYVYVTGSCGGVYYRYDWAQGKPVAVNPNTDNAMPSGPQLGLLGTTGTNCYPTAWADYSLLLESGCTTPVLDLAQFNSTNINGLSNQNQFSGRIWISVGTPKIPFVAVAGGITQPNLIKAPNGFGGAVIGDFVEFSIGTSGQYPQFFCDTSQVDGVGIPLSVQVTGSGITSSSPTGVVGQYVCSRSALLNKFAALKNPLFNSVVSIPTDPTMVAPGTYPASSITGGYFGVQSAANSSAASGSSFFNSAVSEAWQFWASNPITVSNVVSGTSQTTWYGLANGGMLNFYNQMPSVSSPSSNPAPVFSFNQANVTSADIFACAGELNSDNVIGQQAMGMNIMTAFNRGIAVGATNLNNLPNQWSPAATAFYKSKPYNHYAYLVHQNMYSNLGYAFPYDDVTDQQPYIQVQNQVTSMTIQLSSFV